MRLQLPIFELQRRLYQHGLAMLVLPIQV